MSGTKKPRRKRDISPTHPNAAAIDIGATMHVAAVGPDKASEPVRSFGTFTGDLHRLADWFEQCGVRSVAMESTGVYWIPVFEILDQRGFEVILVNARDAKHVPGRKTDISDAQWLQRLHEYGLLRASFRLKGEVAIMRAYLRQRERLLDYAASHIQHMQKGADANEPATPSRGDRRSLVRPAMQPSFARLQPGSAIRRVLAAHRRPALPCLRGDDRPGELGRQ